MNVAFTAEELQFKRAVREFLEAEFPADTRAKVDGRVRLDKEDYVRWQKILYRKGWAAPNWPVEYGGTGWTPIQKYIFAEEMARVGAPEPVAFGIKMVAPVIFTYGSEEQRQRFLPDILASNVWWCQGYSEPNAGSDLASLKTTAVLEGDHYVVSGTKTWNTLGHYADWIFCLVRTDNTAKKQEGITFLLIDMKTPGITVRPIITLDEDHEVNEVFFDKVRVPVANLIGEENKGWTYAKYLLGHERTGIAAVGRSKRELVFVKRIAGEQHKNGNPLIDDPLFATKLAALEIELMALEVTVLRVISQEGKRRGPGPEASMLKVKGTEVQQRLTELMVEAVGPLGLPFEPDYLEGTIAHSTAGDDDAAPLVPYYFNYRKTSIYGGSNEIQKNIITQMILGL